MTWTPTTLLGGLAVVVGCDGGSVVGSVEGSVEGSVDGSVNLVMIVLLPVAVVVPCW